MNKTLLVFKSRQIGTFSCVKKKKLKIKKKSVAKNKCVLKSLQRSCMIPLIDLKIYKQTMLLAVESLLNEYCFYKQWSFCFWPEAIVDQVLQDNMIRSRNDASPYYD